MKNMKKIFSMLLALAMVIALAVPAMAAETYTITINNTVEGHTYEAYQIFDGTLTEIEGKQVLSNIEWGTSISDGDALLAEFNGTYNQTAADAAAMAEWIANNVTSDSERIDAIAALFGKYLDAPAGISTYADGKYTITGLDAGYYLVKDQDDTLDEAYDAYTKYILRVVKDQEVTPKSDIPEVEKTINDTLGGTYGEHEDFDIVDIAYYKWEGTLPSNLKDYDEYSYTFVDTLPTGIVFEAIQQIYIEGHDGNVVHTFYDINDDTNNTLPISVDDGESDVPTDVETLSLNVEGLQVTKNSEDGYDYGGTEKSDTTSAVVTLTFSDLLDLYPSLLNTHKVVVKYTALVNRDAVIGEAMENSVILKYSNNPNGDGEGKTTEDKAYAFTFEINVDKYDADDPSKKLENAKFILYYERIEKDDEGNDTVVKYYAKVVTEEMIEEGKVINGVALTDAYLGNVYGWTNEETEASVLDTDAEGKLRVGGLDADTYYLKEIDPPAGYNLMETPVQVVIKPTYSADGSEVEVSYEVDSIAQSSNTVGVRNSAGSTLPVTGGTGTTMFYVFGSIMAIGAVVLLITKKRMAA